MAISIGDTLPSAVFKQKTYDGMAEVSVAEIFDGKKVVLFAVPGAYTPTCHSNHLPGYLENRDAILAKGVDEIALFVITPVPGSNIFDQFSGYDNYSDLNFSPEWREDYKKLNEFRLMLYRNFLIWKFLNHPIKFLKQPFLFLSTRFKTKMEMTPFRALHTYFLLKRQKV